MDVGWTEEVFDAWLSINAAFGAAARLVGDLDAVRDRLADYTVDMLEHGRRVGSADLVESLAVQRSMYEHLGPILRRHRVLICPTTALPSVEADRSPLDLDLRVNGELVSEVIAAAWFLTYPFNLLSELLAMSVPSGIAHRQLDHAVQLPQ